MFDMSFPDPIVTFVLSILAIVISSATLGVNIVTWLKNREAKKEELAKESEWEQIKFAKELVDSILTKQERLQDYMDKVEMGNLKLHDGRRLDEINNVLRQCKFFGLLVKTKKIQELEQIKQDRGHVYDVWHDLRIEGCEVRSKIIKDETVSTYRRKLKRFDELSSQTAEYWGPNVEDENDEK